MAETANTKPPTSRSHWGPAGWVRGLTAATAVGAFLAISGAFNTGDMSLPGRLAYWIGLLSLGTVWGRVVARYTFGLNPDDSHLWLRVLACSVLIAGPFTTVVWFLDTAFGTTHMGMRASLSLFLVVTLISIVMTTINVLIERGRARTIIVEAQAPAPPRFLERLPLKLRGAEVWAVESEDHYLRLHTSKGQDLILMRLADAVAELEGIEGAQVHRSWWVARDAIADAKRGDGRATLTLKDGSEVPVSRTYAKVLRDRNWI
ncbi:MAG: LytTR family transcriptional regulator DNA-binding domain-containing protein [Phenylobacterium sp.]|nr:LytTR family transcriptional regulator DNA-binding domain-containing protein [Phenylobacterium sp.]